MYVCIYLWWPIYLFNTHNISQYSPYLPLSNQPLGRPGRAVSPDRQANAFGLSSQLVEVEQVQSLPTAERDGTLRNAKMLRMRDFPLAQDDPRDVLSICRFMTYMYNIYTYILDEFFILDLPASRKSAQPAFRWQDRRFCCFQATLQHSVCYSQKIYIGMHTLSYKTLSYTSTGTIQLHVCSDSFWFFLILSDSFWFFLILSDSFWFFLILSDSFWFFLILSDSFWFFLILSDL